MFGFVTGASSGVGEAFACRLGADGWDLAITAHVYPRTGRSFHTGRCAARLLREAGLPDVQVRVLARLSEADHGRGQPR